MNAPQMVLAASLTVLAFAIVLVIVRLVRGPINADRVVALDLLSSVGISVAAVYGMLFDQPAFLDVAIVLALLGFLGTVAFAAYLERRSRR